MVSFGYSCIDEALNRNHHASILRLLEEEERFVVITEAKVLTQIQTIDTDDSSNRLFRWAIEFNNYDMVIKHSAGRLSVVPEEIKSTMEVLEATSVSDEFQVQLLERIKKKIKYT